MTYDESVFYGLLIKGGLKSAAEYLGGSHALFAQSGLEMEE